MEERKYLGVYYKHINNLKNQKSQAVIFSVITFWERQSLNYHLQDEGIVLRKMNLYLATEAIVFCEQKVILDFNQSWDEDKVNIDLWFKQLV